MAIDLIGTGTNALGGAMNRLLGQPTQMSDPTGIRGGFGYNTPYSGDPTGIRGGFSYGPGYDKFMGLVDQDIASIYSSQQQQQQSAPGMGYSGGGQATVAGGNWAALDAHNNEINNAAAKYGIP
ncbi:MAG TPA: hypothetical protein VLA89_15870, partial [Gemmatimonadales bacterium]|nr:hypothetical protein [Gemmatimonadales bacterium]